MGTLSAKVAVVTGAASGIGLATSTGAHAFDGGLARARWGGNDAAPIFGPGKTVGAFAVQASGALATYVVGRAAHNSNIATLGSEIFRAQVVAHYAARTGRSVDRFEFYQVYGLFRLAVIAQQIYYRFHHGQTTNPQYAAFGVLTRILEDRCLSLMT